MTQGHLLSIDVGTTTGRVMLFDLEGRPVAEAYAEPAVYHPQPNWAEVDAEERWRCVVGLLREVLQRPGIAPESVLAIGLSGLMHAPIPLGHDGEPLARAMLWMDQRCQPQADWMMREHRDELERAIGAAWMSTTPSAPKLRWIVEHAPDLLRQTRVFLLMKDYIRFKLTGDLSTDPSDAGGTSLYDRRSGDWSHAMLDLVGVPPEKMPPIRDSTHVVGGVTEEAARLTGLRAGTPVVVGGSDVRCTRIGANAEDSGRACLYMGTAAWIATPHRRPGAFGATATTGATLKWLVGLLGLGGQGSPADSYNRLLQNAERATPGAKGLIFLPHLMGERGPRPDPFAKGVFFGLSMAHGRAEMVRAVLEGCALHLRSILDGLGPVDEMAIVGGGAKSPLWRKIIADATGVTLLVPEVLEAGALGAAILAGVGVGIYPSVGEAAGRLVRVAERCEPDGARHRLYTHIYEVYRELEERVAPLYSRVPVRESEEE